MVQGGSIGDLTVKGAGVKVAIEDAVVAMKLSGNFDAVCASGDLTVINKLIVTEGSVRNFHLDGLDVSTIRLDCDVDDLVLNNCVVHGFRINGSNGSSLKINDCLLFNITEISGCDYAACALTNNSFSYTRISSHFKSIDFNSSRFTMLLDLRGTRVDDKLDFTDTILVESMKLPKPEKYGGRIVFNGMVVKGAVNISLPGNRIDDERFFDEMVKCNSVEGLKVARTILEDNCLYPMADNAFVAQKKKDIEDKKNPMGKRVLNILSYAFGGNGMRPSFILLWMVFTMLAFAAVFCLLDMHSTLLEDNGFLGSLMLSMTSFFLYDIISHGAGQLYLCLAEGVIGLLSMLYFTMVLTRKLLRRSEPGDQTILPSR